MSLNIEQVAMICCGKDLKSCTKEQSEYVYKVMGIGQQVIKSSDRLLDSIAKEVKSKK